MNGFQRSLCAARNVLFDEIRWGPGSASKACNSKCPQGWVMLSKNSHVAGQKSGCKSGKYAPLCVFGMRISRYTAACATDMTSQFFSGGLSIRKDLEGISSFDFEDNSGDRETVSPHLAEFRSLQARRQERRTKNKRSIGSGNPCDGRLPLDYLPLDIPATFSLNGYQWDLNPASPRITTTSNRWTRTVTRHVTTTSYSTGTRTCDGKLFPQPCYHYSSVAQLGTYSRATCSNLDRSGTSRPLPTAYDAGHKNKVWLSYIAQSYTNPRNKHTKLTCQRDEVS